MFDDPELEQTLHDAYQAHSTLLVDKPPDEIEDRLNLLREIVKKSPPRNEGDQLFVRDGDGGYWFPLMDTISVGKGEEADLRLVSEYISKKHCCLHQIDGGWAVKDLNSANGVYVNGEKVTERYLKYGDMIQIADQCLIFVTIRSLIS